MNHCLSFFILSIFLISPYISISPGFYMIVYSCLSHMCTVYRYIENISRMSFVCLQTSADPHHFHHISMHTFIVSLSYLSYALLSFFSLISRIYLSYMYISLIPFHMSCTFSSYLLHTYIQFRLLTVAFSSFLPVARSFPSFFPVSPSRIPHIFFLLPALISPISQYLPLVSRLIRASVGVQFLYHLRNCWLLKIHSRVRRVKLFTALAASGAFFIPLLVLRQVCGKWLRFLPIPLPVLGQVPPSFF